MTEPAASGPELPAPSAPDEAPLAVDEVLVSVAPGETRAAFLQRGQLQRLVVDRGRLRVGALFLGRVIRVVPALEAAFVDIGLDDAGFLELAEARPAGAAGGTIKQFITEGDCVLVQVIRTPIGGKGPKLTLRPALIGAHVVLFPYASGIAVSAETERTADVLAALEAVLPGDAGGWTLLPAAAGASPATILAEARQLCASWQELLARSRAAKPPVALAAGPDPVVAALSEEWTPALVRVVVDEPRAAARLRTALPDLTGRIETHLSGAPLFSESDLEEQIEALVAPEVGLRCGGTVSIAETAAVVAIDVDAGAADQGGREATALAVNREAADMIARHLRLRDLAGHVVIDFVPMRRRGNQRRLLDHLRRAFARHRSAVDLAGFTRLGLVELTRRRTGPSLAETMLAPCRTCAGRGVVLSPVTLALKALRQILAEDRAAPGREWAIEAAPDVIAAFSGAALAARRETEARLGRPLQLRASVRQTADSYKLMVNPDRERME